MPTLPDLEKRGLAEVAERNRSREPTHYRPTPEGQALIYETMARNAARARAQREEHHDG